ncbi:MAG: GNAT family N-acetyltransferase [Gammaproteobacteria bacterium]|jgi:GNAT superfamily N-acetyltransferase|nr:GNAT family N-acetyltransferase [Gammaproteobacteria bacterium]
MHKIIETRHDDYLISTDPAKLDLEAIHAALSTAYWSTDISKAVVEKALAHSLCFGLYQGQQQVGLSRVVTDYATYAYLCDVYVLEAHRGKGLGHWMVECIMTHPELQNLRRFTLATRDAHGIYAAFGFTALKAPDRMMERHDPQVYQRMAAEAAKL